MTTDLKSMTVEELKQTVWWRSELPAFDELADRLKVLQGHFNEVDTALRVSEDEVLRLRNSLKEAQQRNEAHDAELTATAKAEADAARDCAVTATTFEVAANIADDGFEGNHGNDVYTRQNLASTYRQKAAEYRAKAGRKE